MNKTRFLWMMSAAVLLLMMFATASGEANDCWYYAKNGTHDFEQTDAGYATCTEDGYYVVECRQCGYNHREITQYAYGHSFEQTELVYATCVEEGYFVGTCRNCGYKEKEITQSAYGHDWVETHREEPSNCTYGIIIEECNNCNQSRSEKIYPKGTLYRGIKDSAAVKELQQMLIDCGYLNDKADGIFGKNTEAAVKAFQKAAGLSVDGIAWPQTIDTLESKWTSRAKATPTPTPVPTAAVNTEKFYPDFCYSWEDENGSTVYEYCQTHADMFAAQGNLLSNPALIDYSYEMWRHEIISLYDKWIALLPEEAQEPVAAGKAMCLSMMDAQRTAMFTSYEACATGIFNTDAEYGMELWMRTHTSWLCQMLNTLATEE